MALDPQSVSEYMKPPICLSDLELRVFGVNRGDYESWATQQDPDIRFVLCSPISCYLLDTSNLS